MRFYAERPVRLALQVLTDVLVVAWVVLCVLVARASHAVVLRLGDPGVGMARAGESMRTAFDDAASTASNIPLIGEDLARALLSGSDAGNTLVNTGEQQVETIQTMATGTATSVVLVGALPVVLVWLLFRIRYARRASSAVLIRQTDTDLLALRALTHLPVRQLLAATAARDPAAGPPLDPASAWRAGDRLTMYRLAELELRSLGLWAPSRPPD
jgi:hypothetical protein